MSNLECWLAPPRDARKRHVAEVVIPDGSAGAIRLHQGESCQARHQHQAVELNVVMAGQGRCVVEERIHSLAAGSLLWILTGQEHEFSDLSGDFEMWVVSFRSGLLEEHAALPEARAGTRGTADELCHAVPWSDLWWLDAELERLCSVGASDVLNAGLLYCALGAREMCVGPQRPRRAMTPEVEAALHLVEANPELAGTEVAARVGCSLKRLRRGFRDQVGVGLRAFQNRTRLERFAELIVGGAPSFLDACFRAGFGSYAQCHRLFTERMRCSPREYVARMRSDLARPSPAGAS